MKSIVPKIHKQLEDVWHGYRVSSSKSSFVIIGIMCSALMACSFFAPGLTTLEKADQARKNGRYKLAIKHYQQHLEQRLATKWKIKNENPYFWLLTIGDVHLEAGDPIKARQIYDEALNKKVDTLLLVDRYLTLATWYRDHDNYEQALEILKHYRDLDLLLFNGTLDKFSKEILAKEDYE